MLYLFFIAVLAWAQADTSKILEVTYPRDSSVCYIGGQRFELIIRGDQKYMEPGQKVYGEYILFSKNKRILPLPFSKPKSETYKFFEGKNTLCSKTNAFLLKKDRLAVLFLKENLPLKEKLVIQQFDIKTLEPLEVLETEYMTDKVVAIPDGFAFQSLEERLEPEMGKVMIEGNEHLYQDRAFSLWINYLENKFEINPSLTFRNFGMKNFFENEDDFLKAAGWDSQKKNFINPIIYVAVNHKNNRQCVLLTNERRKLAGSESWRCRQRP
jgi:hypothetical protein